VRPRGFPASVIGARLAPYVALDSLGDADKAVEILGKG